MDVMRHTYPPWMWTAGGMARFVFCTYGDRVTHGSVSHILTLGDSILCVRFSPYPIHHVRLFEKEVVIVPDKVGCILFRCVSELSSCAAGHIFSEM